MIEMYTRTPRFKDCVEPLLSAGLEFEDKALLPQMHRPERTVAEVVSLLVKQAYGIGYVPGNVPGKYLAAIILLGDRGCCVPDPILYNAEG